MLGSLGVAHFVVAVALLPVVVLALSYGFFLKLAILPGLTWLGILGWRLLRFKESLRKALRITHLVLAPCAAFLVSRGFLLLDSAESGTQAGGGYAAAFGVIALVMGLLAGGLSIVSLCVSFLSTFKTANSADQPDPLVGGRQAAVLPEMSGLARKDREVGRGRVIRWTIRCLALSHWALGMVLLLLASAYCRICRMALSGRTCLLPSEWLHCRQVHWQALVCGS